VEAAMSRTISFTIDIPDILKKADVNRELQVLTDGFLVRTINIQNNGQIGIENLEVVDNTTITVELRDVYGNGGMSAPLVHEFTITDGTPQPQSDIFQVTIAKV
jgi:hypothetical protein